MKSSIVYPTIPRSLEMQTNLFFSKPNCHLIYQIINTISFIDFNFRIRLLGTFLSMNPLRNMFGFIILGLKF